MKVQPGGRAEIEREMAFFRKHLHRMCYHALKEEGIAIGAGVVGFFILSTKYSSLSQHNKTKHGASSKRADQTG